MDTLIFNLIFGLSHKFWVLDYLGIFVAQYLGYVLAVLALILIFSFKNWQEKFYFFSFTALSLILSRGIIAEIIKFVVKRQRPFMVLNIQPLIKDSGYSLPSGHASFFFALALAVYYFDKKWGVRFLVCALLISFSRIFVGIHWPLDILLGMSIGLASAFAVNKLLEKYKPLSVKENMLNDELA